MGARAVLLLRHGRTAFNLENRFQGQTDIPLDDVGLGQAKRAADLLAEQPGLADEPVRIVSSDLSRASRTAEQIATRLGVELTLDPRLREIYAGSWEGLLRTEIEAMAPDDFAAWGRGDYDVKLGGGESRRDAASRAAEAIDDVEKTMDGGTLICVSHGGALRGAIFVLMGVPSWPWGAMESLRNAHWAEMRRLSRGWRLSSYNVG
jgi:broad specificity phosphatase PhoE